MEKNSFLLKTALAAFLAGSVAFLPSCNTMQNKITNPVGLEKKVEEHPKCTGTETSYALIVKVGGKSKAPEKAYEALKKRGIKNIYFLKEAPLDKNHDDNRSATKENILDMIDSLATQINLCDRFIFLISGHGEIDYGKQESIFLFGKNRTPLPAGKLKRALEKIRATKKMAFLLACSQGKLAKELGEKGYLTFASNDGFKKGYTCEECWEMHFWKELAKSPNIEEIFRNAKREGKGTNSKNTELYKEYGYKNNPVMYSGTDPSQIFLSEKKSKKAEYNPDKKSQKLSTKKLNQ
ncbi:MAG: caspase family protein [Nanoarchaeota archaeon]|nr:caspase family protein [Nanoarchaeota archaeon]